MPNCSKYLNKAAYPIGYTALWQNTTTSYELLALIILLVFVLVFLLILVLIVLLVIVLVVVLIVVLVLILVEVHINTSLLTDNIIIKFLGIIQ